MEPLRASYCFESTESPPSESEILFSSLLKAQARELRIPKSLIARCFPLPPSGSWVQDKNFFAYRDEMSFYIQSTNEIASGGEKTAYEGHKFDLEVDETTTHLGSDPVVFLIPNEPGLWNRHEFSIADECESDYLVQTIAHHQVGKGKGRMGCAIQQRLITLEECASTINDIALRTLFTDYQKGLNALHSKAYVHKDVKIENLFISDEEELKGLVGDFGASARISDMGSPAVGMQFESYSPPRLLEAEGLYRALSPTNAMASSTLAKIQYLMNERGLVSPTTTPIPVGKSLLEEHLHFEPMDDFFALDRTFRTLLKGREDEFPLTFAEIAALKIEGK